ncbi:hypothetical protein IQ06DRAFT_153353 [Phaeosphaeriaceae sp. SRC1lsM3a]|nr:hypothetical protein IQ06DRAFT_153353 [Stagonospora sp. SRC1lsM3a]
MLRLLLQLLQRPTPKCSRPVSSLRVASASSTWSSPTSAAPPPTLAPRWAWPPKCPPPPPNSWASSWLSSAGLPQLWSSLLAMRHAWVVALVGMVMTMKMMTPAAARPRSRLLTLAQVMAEGVVVGVVVVVEDVLLAVVVAVAQFGRGFGAVRAIVTKKTVMMRPMMVVRVVLVLVVRVLVLVVRVLVLVVVLE